MNTCKTCKSWGWRKYDPICDLPDTVQFPCKSSHMAGDDPAGMVDAEDYGGVLTGPDFGCIHYEETQEQLPQGHPGYATKSARDNEAAVTLPTGTDTSLRREIESALKSGHHVFLKA